MAEEEGRDWIDEALERGMGFKSEQERQDYVKSIGDPLLHPMFATNTQDLAGNPLADAIRMLREEDKTMVQLILMYKDEGNELLKKFEYDESMRKYDYAMSFIDKADELRQNGTEAEEDKTIDLLQLRSQLYNNKALISLQLRNYRSVINDTNLAIKYWNKNIKAYYRKCKALYHLKLYDECLQTYAEALNIDDVTQLKDFASLYNDCMKSIQKITDLNLAKIKQNEALITRWKSTWSLIREVEAKIQHTAAGGGNSNNRASTDRHIVLGYNINEPPEQLKDTYPSAIEDAGGFIYQWPVLFLYPQYNQMDLIPDANTDAMLVDYLAHMFPEASEGSGRNAPWDRDNEYHISKLVVYILLESSLVVADEDAWVACCAEERQVTGAEGEEAASSAIKAMNERHKQHLQTHTLKYEKQRICPYVEVHLGVQLSQVLTIPGHVIAGGRLTFIIHVRGNEAHLRFISGLKADGCENIQVYQPNNTAIWEKL